MYECPWSWITEETRELLDAVYLFDDKNLLPFPGLWTDQPYWFIEAFRVYKKEQSDHIKNTQPDT